MTDKARAGEPRTEAGRALMRIGQEWAIRGSRASRTIEHEQGWTDGTYQTNEELFRRIVLAIEAAAAPSLDVDVLAALMCEVTMPDGSPCHGHRREAERIAGFVTRLSEKAS